MQFYLEPPYFLLVAGLFIGVTSGVAFEATLKELVQEWYRQRSSHTLATMQGSHLQVPYLGIAIGIALFLGSGLEIFGFSRFLSYAVALPLTVLTAWLVWSQLGKILVQLERGGSKAIDLDSIG